MALCARDGDMNESEYFNKSEDFSLVLGGPLYQFLIRARLEDSALGHLTVRILVLTLFAWLPLFLLSLLAGTALGGVRIPFLYDVEMQMRFLVALPLLIGAELLLHKRLRIVVQQFVERGIIPEEALPRFGEIIDSAMRLRNSIAVEVTLLLIVFVGGHFLWSAASGMGQVVQQTATWYATKSEGVVRLTPAGYWYSFVSRPLFQFILVRWYFRLFVWARFLWQVSRLNLHLIPTHPDRAAGLGFLSVSVYAMSLLILAHGTLLSGVLAGRIFYTGSKLMDFKVEGIAVIGIIMVMVLGPLLVFSPHLMRAKKAGLREYGKLASRYVEEFDQKWIRGHAPGDEQLIGSGDIQSLADMGNSFEIIKGIRPIPFTKETVIQLIIIILLPVYPLALTMMPLEELIKKFIGVIF
jgi:hypothetical protein